LLRKLKYSQRSPPQSPRQAAPLRLTHLQLLRLLQVLPLLRLLQLLLPLLLLQWLLLLHPLQMLPLLRLSLLCLSLLCLSLLHLLLLLRVPPQMWLPQRATATLLAPLMLLLSLLLQTMPSPLELSLWPRLWVNCSLSRFCS
jgi:hypothetical protein